MDFAKQQKPEPDKTNSNSCVPFYPVSGSLQKGLFHVAKKECLSVKTDTLALSSCTLKAFESTKKMVLKKENYVGVLAVELYFCSQSSFPVIGAGRE